ncbi:MAG: DNA repair protein RecN, partial [Candidatus Omnitrophica bacterium]|nr:DNA repair protein RecN [Candidatus Omnitrophota bacterium]
QTQEIDAAELRIGEDEEIAARLQVIQHAEKLHEGCRRIVHKLQEGGEQDAPLLDELDRLESVLLDMEQIDPSLKPVVECWKPALISLHEAARELEAREQALEFDPGELDRLQNRRFLIKSLKNKYGASIAEVLAFRDRCRDELRAIEHRDEERERLRAEELRLRAELIDLGKTLRRRRQAAARKISKRIEAELSPLGMEAARFEIQVGYRPDADGLDIGEKEPAAFGPGGADEVDFLISAIPGRPLRPLREAASGGEISRIMLAIKCVFGKADSVPLMVFDEIDAGVGGETADAVAERLAALSREKQVLCITHLPQIASRADCNLRVDKEEQQGRLVSRVSALQGKAREQELARMLGQKNSPASQRYAREMLKKAGKG